MQKTYMMNCYKLDVVKNLGSDSEILATVLYGIVTIDDTLRFPEGYQVITSPIDEKLSTDYYTKKGSIYNVIGEISALVISFREWQIMRDKTLSPSEIVTLRDSDKSL